MIRIKIDLLYHLVVHYSQDRKTHDLASLSPITNAQNSTKSFEVHRDDHLGT